MGVEDGLKGEKGKEKSREHFSLGKTRNEENRYFKKILKRVGLIIYYIIQGSQTHVFLNLKFPEVILTTELLKQLAIGPSPPN